MKEKKHGLVQVLKQVMLGSFLHLYDILDGLSNSSILNFFLSMTLYLSDMLLSIVFNRSKMQKKNLRGEAVDRAWRFAHLFHFK